MKKQKKYKRNIMGNFTLPNGTNAGGVLKFRGRNTVLKLHLKEGLPNDYGFTVTGQTSNGSLVTLRGCGYNSIKNHQTSAEESWTEAEIYSHDIIIGHRHLVDEDEKNIEFINLSTRDLAVAFYDSSAFGKTITTDELIDAATAENRKYREIKIGKLPFLLYYTGESCIFEAITELGRVTVRHIVTTDSGSMAGVFASSKLNLQIEPTTPISLNQAKDLVNQISTFIAYIVGRTQEVKQFEIRLSTDQSKYKRLLTVIPTFVWMSSKSSARKPDWRDMPLVLFLNRDAYQKLLQQWVLLSPTRTAARIRYLGCISHGYSYPIDRIVAAANMFDILPDVAFPISPALDPKISDARDSAKAIFKNLPDSLERSSALSALGRIGKLSLPAKVLCRVEIITAAAAEYFPNLARISSIAVKVRNFYVHGSEINREAIEPSQVFLTESLEFIFAASELIECGWEIQDWLKAPHLSNHKFTDFVLAYKSEANSLLQRLDG